MWHRLILLLTSQGGWARPVGVGVDVESDLARGLVWSVAVLMGVTGGVMAALVVFLLHLTSRSRTTLGRRPGGLDQRSAAPSGPVRHLRPGPLRPSGD